MLDIAKTVLLIYAILMAAGGVIGYATAKSKASLVAGLLSGLALLAAWAWARSSPRPGLLTAAAVTLPLVVVFGLRFSKTGAFMPSGMLLVLSVLALIVFAWALLTLHS